MLHPLSRCHALLVGVAHASHFCNVVGGVFHPRHGVATGEHDLATVWLLEYGSLEQFRVHEVLPCREARLVEHEQICLRVVRLFEQCALPAAQRRSLGCVEQSREATVGVARKYGGSKPSQGRNLTAGAVFAKLKNNHGLSAPECPCRQSHGRRGLALAISAIEVHESLPPECLEGLLCCCHANLSIAW